MQKNKTALFCLHGRQVLGSDHEDTGKCLNNLALDLKGQGRNDEALNLEEEALDIIQRATGDDSIATATSTNNLANSYANMGRHADAARLHEKVLDMRTQSLGATHSQTIASMDMLGTDYLATGDEEKAVHIQEEAVRLAKSNLGHSNETTIKCMINLGNTYNRTGNYEKSIPLLESTLAAARPASDVETPLNPNIVGVMNALGISYVRMDRFHDAKPLLERCYEWNKETLGPDNPRSKISLQNLEYVYGKLEILVRTSAINI